MHQDYLISAGLSEGEAKVYDFLLKSGEKPASDVIEKTGLKRGNTYNILESLVVKGLVVQQDKNKIAHFRVENPRALLELFERNKAELETKRHAVEAVLPSLISQYQLSTNKPVVSYFEGEKGIEQVVNDTLTSKGEILQYMDYDQIHTHIKHIATNYLKKRKELGLNKKIIILNGPEAKKYYSEPKELTEVRFIEKSDRSFGVSMHIYDNKVSYFSFIDDKKIGVIIDDEKIASMHRDLFLTLFNSL